VFENRVLRRIFGPRRDVVTGGWRKLHNEELHKLYSSPSIIRIINVYLSNIPAIATENLLVLLLFTVHNMFRPLRAILR
jgi:hypothetical protein